MWRIYKRLDHHRYYVVGSAKDGHDAEAIRRKCQQEQPDTEFLLIDGWLHLPDLSSQEAK